MDARVEELGLLVGGGEQMGGGRHFGEVVIGGAYASYGGGIHRPQVVVAVDACAYVVVLLEAKGVGGQFSLEQVVAHH